MPKAGRNKRLELPPKDLNSTKKSRGVATEGLGECEGGQDALRSPLVANDTNGVQSNAMESIGDGVRVRKVRKIDQEKKSSKKLRSDVLESKG